MNNQRHSYCTHPDSFGLAQDEPMITCEMFQEVALPIRRLNDADWFGMRRQFEVDEPVLSRLKDLAPGGWSDDAQAYFERLLVAIRATFKQYFPAPGPIRPEEVEEATGLIMPYFRRPGVCLCGRFQASLMKCVAGETERSIDEGRLTTAEGNHIALLAAVAIEALDLAATAARWFPAGDKSCSTVKTNAENQPGDQGEAEDPRANHNY